MSFYFYLTVSLRKKCAFSLEEIKKLACWLPFVRKPFVRTPRLYQLCSKHANAKD